MPYSSPRSWPSGSMAWIFPGTGSPEFLTGLRSHRTVASCSVWMLMDAKVIPLLAEIMCGKLPCSRPRWAAEIGREGKSRMDSSSFDDKDGFVVDQSFVAALAQMFVLLYRVLQQRIADVPSRLPVMLP